MLKLNVNALGIHTGMIDMVNSELLKNAAMQAGILYSFINNDGTEQVINDDSLCILLNALGFNTDSDATLVNSIAKHQRKSILKSVKIVNENETIAIDLTLSSNANIADFSWQVTTEDGDIFNGDVTANILADRREGSGLLTFVLPYSLPLGYHQFMLIRKNRKSAINMSLIIVPERCYGSEKLQQGKKNWGVNTQLYSLRSKQNWGVGDFSDLALLINNIAKNGGSFVGINPLHSLFIHDPKSCSPYSPSSRYGLNPIYIDVMKVPDFIENQVANEKVASKEFQGQLDHARQLEHVDYVLVTKLKLQILTLLFQSFEKNHLNCNSTRAKEFLQFINVGGQDLLQLATFDALQAHFSKQKPCRGWQDFPVNFKKFENKTVQKFIKTHRSDIYFYLYLQWIADSQLHNAHKMAQKCHMDIGLYGDLAVGVTAFGAESWTNQSLCRDVTIGAPADYLAPQGQNWGLLPFNPALLAAQGYLPFISLLQSNMANFDALRIDHIVNLLRLWWIPNNHKADKGGYCLYPVDDLLGIVALESHRHQCTIIGEDLGTIPPELFQKLQTAGIYSYKVFLFETAADGGYFSPDHYLPQSMAALCTHDTPTFRGFWEGNDIKKSEILGIYSDKNNIAERYIDRANKKQNIIDSVNWHGNLPKEISRDAAYVNMSQDFNHALQLHLASGSSALVSLQLEDWLNMSEPVNIPGTSQEYVNWQRKLSVDLESIFADKRIQALAKKLTEVRAK